MSLPKEGTLERIVLERMVLHPEGLTYLDFADVNMTEQLMEQTISNLQHAMYESEDDDKLKIDA